MPKKKNPWLAHVAKYRKKHPKLPYKVVLQKAKKTYKKTRKQKGKGVIKTVKNKLTGKVGTTIRNMLNRNPKSRPLYPGEAHAVELSGKYKGSSYNFMGPGTQVEKRIARGDRGINGADEIARVHDMEYVALGKITNKQQRIQAEINADKKFLRKIAKFKYLPEVKAAWVAIAGKLAGQLAGKIPWGGSPV